MSIKEALKRAGSINALAKMLGVKRQAVQQWMLRGMPVEREIQLMATRPEWFVKAKK